MKKMSHLKQYEDAIVYNKQGFTINALPVLSSDFHYQFVKN
jgi:hypothetical protein